MSDATALDSARTGTPDGSSGIKIPTILCQEDSTLEAPCGVSISDVISDSLSAHRAGITSDSGVTDMRVTGFGATNVDRINNRGGLVVWVKFDSLANCVLRPVWYNSATTSSPMCLGPLMAFTANAKLCDTSGKMYLSEAQIVETMGMKKFKLFLESLSSGIVDIYAVPI
jgi:hypothetical protein